MDAQTTLLALHALNFKEKRILSPLRKCVKKLSVKSSHDLAHLNTLGMWLYIDGYVDQASTVCTLAETIPFTGDFVLWTPVENLLVLGARIHREQGRPAAAAACLAKIAQPMAAHPEALARRLSFAWLSDVSIDRCVQAGDLKAANVWRFSDLSSLFLMREIGEGQRDIDGRPVDTVRAEARAVEYLALLRAAP